MDTITLFHHNSSLKTLKDFMKAERIFGIEAEDLFKENKENIFKQMSLDEKADYAKANNKENITKDDLKSDMVLPCPCLLTIDCKYVTREIAISQTNFEENTDNLYAFENDHIQNIFQDSGYQIDSSTKKIKPSCTVFGWFKSLYYVGRDNASGNIIKSDSNDKNFVEISPFIISLSTNVSDSGGTFNMTLPIIHSVSNNKVGSLNKSIGSYNDRRALRTEMYYHTKINEFFHKVGVNSFHSNFFNWLIQSNDLLFISFEDLEMEERNGIKTFDMIALVESVSENIDANGRGVMNVSGRDLMKLISDDNSLFFNLSSAWGNSQIFANSESEGKQGDIRDIGSNEFSESAMQRIRRSTNEIDIFAEPFNRSISFIIKGVISQLANIEVVPDDTFTAWGDRRTKYNDLYPGGYDVQFGGVGSSSVNGNSPSEHQEEQPNEEFNTGLEYNASKKDYHEIHSGDLSGKGNGNALDLPRNSDVIRGVSDLELGRITIKPLD